MFATNQDNNDGVQSIINEQEDEIFYNINGTNQVLDDKHKHVKLKKRAIKDTLDVQLGNVFDYFGVSMQTMELRKCNDKTDDLYWLMVTHKEYIETLVDTLVQANKINIV